MTPTHASMSSQGEHGALSSEYKALMSLVLNAEINEQWIESITSFITGTKGACMDRLMPI